MVLLEKHSKPIFSTCSMENVIDTSGAKKIEVKQYGA
jgi:hypothetical protein